LAGLVAASLLGGLLAARAPAQSAVGKMNALQAKLDHVEHQQGVATTKISHFNDRIRSLQGQVQALQAKRTQVQAHLDAVQAQLDAAIEQLKTLRAHLAIASQQLSDRLVQIYKSGEPDALTVLLQSDGFDNLVENGEYLKRISDADSNVIDRVRSLRDQVHTTVEQVSAARDEIAARKVELDQNAADLSARKSELAGARAKQKKTLSVLNQQHDHVEGDLSAVSKQVAQQLGTFASPLPAGAIRPGAAGFIWPVNGPVVSPFGMRWGAMHEGVDIAVPAGTPIRAAKAGTIVLAGPTGGYGNYTCIDHGGGLSTCYAHQSSFARTSGPIGQGDVLGYVGCTGHCFGDHLHFEVRINGTAVDPLAYL
jgi:murein DD-endopeptidase MepM/ murein hydrolase activator NlpD